MALGPSSPQPQPMPQEKHTPVPASQPALTGQTWLELWASLSTKTSRWLLIGAGVSGLAAVLVSALGGGVEDRSFQATCSVIQLTMSLLLPLISILLVTRSAIRPGRTVIAAQLLAGVALALMAAAYGIVVAAVVTAVLHPGGSAWRDAGMVVLGSALMQVISQLCGTGFGLLLRSRWAAIVVDVVVPSAAVTALTAPIPVLHRMRPWLEPAQNAGHLLSGQMSAHRWAQCAVVTLIWVVILLTAALWRCSARIQAFR
jgi:hypothetical protein